ncbi:MAG: hypothetical protein DME15_06765 [Candidatus Rokuibacteriota bacterium]|nr:MAG: hypothetical protein DME15_06765 [Candidatus Rokubacteria bacterium]
MFQLLAEGDDPAERVVDAAQQAFQTSKPRLERREPLLQRVIRHPSLRSGPRPARGLMRARAAARATR